MLCLLTSSRIAGRNWQKVSKPRPREKEKKLIEWAAWLSGVDRVDCKTCQYTWSEFDGEPPCETCRPPLTPDVDDAVLIYCRCSGVIPVPLLDAIRIAGIEDQDIDEMISDVQLIASEVENIRGDSTQEKEQEQWRINLNLLARGLDSPVSSGFDVTPNDSADLETLPRALYVGTSGDVTVTLSGTELTFKDASGLLPIRPSRVWDTGTTASDIIALY